MSYADVAVFGTVVVAFALLVTAHLAIVVGLGRRPPRSRSVVALIVPPLAPYWALREGMSVRGGLWLAAALTYAVARGLAL
jgi:hypothetical protein